MTLGLLDSLAFAGDEVVTGFPLEPVLDLNVMTRRGKVLTHVRQIEGPISTEARTALLIDPVSLDAILIEGGGHVPVDGLRLLIEVR